MTVIYSNSGDRDTELLKRIWQGLQVDKYIEINSSSEDYDDEVDEALAQEKDTLILCGHGTSLGLLYPNLAGQYIIHENNVNLIHARKVIGIWCWAASFAEQHHLSGFFTGMFISNVKEAEGFDLSNVHSNYDDLDKDIYYYELYFTNHLHELLENHISLNDWLDTFSDSPLNFYNVIGYFNFKGFRYIN